MWEGLVLIANTYTTFRKMEYNFPDVVVFILPYVFAYSLY